MPRVDRSSPALVALTALLLYAVWVGWAHHIGHDWRDWDAVGRHFVTASETSPEIARDGPYATSRFGYDGQFFLYIARDPADAVPYLDNASYRYGRIVYPLAARGLALGRQAAIPLALVLVNLLAVGVGTWAVAAWLRRESFPEWFALLYAAFPGVFFGVWRDLSEPLAYALAAVALLVFDGDRSRRIALSSALMAVPAVAAFATGEVAGVRATVSRTGYTGEDGFEIYLAPAAAERLFTAVLAAGREAGVVPCGLGARDTLRLEAGMRLCGSDMDDQTTVLEAGLGWIVGWKKDAFIGSDVLGRQKAEGLTHTLAAFEMTERAIARHGHAVLRGGASVGVVTSGTFTPFLKKAIGFARVPADMAAVGTEFDVDIRGRRARAVVVPEPFYKRAKAS